MHPAFFALFFVGVARADIYEYKNVNLNTGLYHVRRVEMFSPKESPSDSAPGNGNAFIQLEVNFERAATKSEKQLEEGEIEATVLHNMTLDIGYWMEDEGEKKFHTCCNEELAAKLGDNSDICDQTNLNKMIIRNPHNIKNSQKIKFPSGSLFASAHKSNAHFPVTQSGPHLLVLANCDARLRDFDVTFSGKTLWMNPYGYLPAQSYYFMPFFGTMALVYGVIAVGWLILNAIHWKDIVALQNYITCVLAVCLIENMVLYFDYASFNQNGHRNEAILLLGVLVTMARRTISRMLIMAVSIGFAIVRPDLGKNKKHILNFGLVYFVLGLSQQILIDLGKVHDKIGDHWRTLLSIPVAAADSGCYWFIFVSLYHLITMLRVRQQLVKLAVYKAFTKVLIFSLLCASVFAIYHLYLTASKSVLSHWRIWWFLDEGIWHILFSVIFIAICYLFRPSQSAKRYAYSQLSTDMADDEYGLEEDGGALEMNEIATEEPLFTLGDEDVEPVVDKKTAKVD